MNLSALRTFELVEELKMWNYYHLQEVKKNANVYRIYQRISIHAQRAACTGIWYL